MSEEELINHAKAGNQVAFAQLMARHRPFIHAIAISYFRDADLEDAIQETMIRTWNSLVAGKFSGASLRPWLRVVAHNVCRDIRRYQKRQRTVSLEKVCAGQDRGDDEIDWADPARSLEDLVMGNERLAEITLAIRQEGPDWARIVDLVLVQGLRYKDVAQMMGIPEGTVKSRLNRSRSRLKRILNDADC